MSLYWDHLSKSSCTLRHLADVIFIISVIHSSALQSCHFIERAISPNHKSQKYGSVKPSSKRDQNMLSEVATLSPWIRNLSCHCSLKFAQFPFFHSFIRIVATVSWVTSHLQPEYCFCWLLVQRAYIIFPILSLTIGVLGHQRLMGLL